MITEVRRRHSIRRERAQLERVIRGAEGKHRDELIVIARRQGLL
jgi:hypothetical protein